MSPSSNDDLYSVYRIQNTDRLRERLFLQRQSVFVINEFFEENLKDVGFRRDRKQSP